MFAGVKIGVELMTYAGVLVTSRPCQLRCRRNVASACKSRKALGMSPTSSKFSMKAAVASDKVSLSTPLTQGEPVMK